MTNNGVMYFFFRKVLVNGNITVIGKNKLGELWMNLREKN